MTDTVAAHKRYLFRTFAFMGGYVAVNMAAIFGAFDDAAGWGFMESYGGAPHAPGWIIFPLFWGLYGLVTPFVRDSH